MECKFKVNTTENTSLVIAGIVIFYLLVEVFIGYFYFMHKMSFHTFFVLSTIFIIVYVPRFYIIKKIIKKDEIKIDDGFLHVNSTCVKLEDIVDAKIEHKKPQVVFYFNNNRIVYNEAVCHLRLKDYQTSFFIIGEEKIQLMEEFLNTIIEKNK